eukprot:TRINITY_DN7903_c0_g1_i1.p1 TRINITY_DN7903_c0_g1~~TRINITY_DN7903_c0_g1_i1.p1  ORF type:complete len:109 (+),score=22.46 TRINITY_DN7903_c0_g1_i1:55-381(+)
MNSLKHYELERVCGEGAFSKVVIAKHKVSGERVAIKVINKNEIVDPVDRAAIEQEKKLLQLVKHPNAISLKEIVELGPFLQLITEYYPNGDLLGFIRQNEGRLGFFLF